MRKSRDALALADAHQQNRDLRNELDRCAQPLRQRIRELEAEIEAARAQRSRDTVEIMLYAPSVAASTGSHCRR